MKAYPPSRPAANGSALIITLFFMGMIVAATLAILISARLERSVAHSHFDQKRASELAHEGVERVVAALAKQTAYQYSIPDPSAPDGSGKTYRYRNYLTRPGGLVVPAATPSGNGTTDATTQNVLTQPVQLSTGLSSGTASADPVYAAPSLNIPTFVQPASGAYTTYTVLDRPYTPPGGSPSGKVSAMKLKWVYIHQDPNPATGQSSMYEDPVDQSLTPDSRANDSSMTDLPKIDPTKPIIGRFAYWTDDESTKINYNLAWKKSLAATTSSNMATTNTSILVDPSQVSLEALLKPGATSDYFTNADAVHTWTTKTPGRYFNSFADARQVDSNSVSPVIDYNNFELTHYNHDPDTTFFGDDRILLTTDPRLVPKNSDGSYARKFLDVLREDTTSDFLNNPPDPGLQANIAAGEKDANNLYVPSGSTHYPGLAVTNKFDMVVKNLVRYINQTNWPIMPDKPSASFQTKYYQGQSNTDGAAVAQLAVAIIDYVRARESTQTAVAPTRFGYDGYNYSTLYTLVSNKSKAFQGSSRMPLCTEMGYAVESSVGGGVTKCPDGTPLSAGGTQTFYRMWARYEYYLPTHYNLPKGIELVPTSGPKWAISAIMTGSATRYFETPNNAIVALTDYTREQITTKNLVIYNPPGATAPTPTTLMPGGYAVITIPFYSSETYEDAATPKIAIRAGLDFTSFKADEVTVATAATYSALYEIAPQYYITASSRVPCTPSKYTSNGGAAQDPKTVTINNSVETDDPRCNISPFDWVSTTSPSWGAKNTRSTLGKPASTITPQQDTDASGNITDYSLYMPAPRDLASTDPQNGRVTSVGELGYVTTGLNSDNTQANVNWRTFRLQPNNYLDSTVLPDWAFADLFAAPNIKRDASGQPALGKAIFDPHDNSVGGRVNINSGVTPFTDVNRDRALAALFHEAHDPSASATTALSSSAAEQLGQNLATQTLAPRTSGNSGKNYGSMGLTTLLPNKVYDSPGEICEIKGIADGGEGSEDLVRQVSSLICSRGGVFSVYTIGQAIQQSPAGKLTVTAEQRQQSIVERYVANRNTPSATDDQVRFRTVYTRNLTP